MKRRNFIGSLAALVVAPFVPTPAPVAPRTGAVSIHVFQSECVIEWASIEKALDDADREFKIGEVVTVPLPQRYRMRDVRL